MKLNIILPLLILFISCLKANSQSFHPSLRSPQVDSKESVNNHLACGEKCIQEKSQRALQDANGSGNNPGVKDIIDNNMNNLYKDLANQAQEQAKSTWDSLSSGAKAGIIIAVVVVAVIIIAGIVHCLCICKLCCCCC
ncbi:hypothetical protein HWI79_3348 [Cryptosporidium felis]|nr:hypothetical protein HWI79_3348 [Cryptosporidium felis]